MKESLLILLCFIVFVSCESTNDHSRTPDKNSPNHTPLEQIEENNSTDEAKETTHNNPIDSLKNKAVKPDKGSTLQNDVLDIEDETEVFINGPTEIIKDEDENIEEDPEPESTYDFHAYEDYNTFLKKYVSSSGRVNYAGIQGDKETLQDIITEFNKQYPTSDWTYNQKLAFWINTYNVFTIKLIIDNYPTTSITKIAAKPWEIKSVKLKGKTYSLDHVENQIIRKKFNEPRIHFALNCASESCPILLNKAYKASTVGSQLTAQTKKFLNDSSKNTYGKKEITISQLFNWYSEDFTKNGNTVIGFINKYRTEQLKNQKIKYGAYSWELND